MSRFTFLSLERVCQYLFSFLIIKWGRENEDLCDLKLYTRSDSYTEKFLFSCWFPYVISHCSSIGSDSLFYFVRKWILGCLVLTAPCSLFTLVQVLSSLFSLPWSQFRCQFFFLSSRRFPLRIEFDSLRWIKSLAWSLYLLSCAFPAHPQSVRLWGLVILGFYAKTKYSSYTWHRINYSTLMAKSVHR
jgi:hypothetical protein